MLIGSVNFYHKIPDIGKLMNDKTKEIVNWMKSFQIFSLVMKLKCKNSHFKCIPTPIILESTWMVIKNGVERVEEESDSKYRKNNSLWRIKWKQLCKYAFSFFSLSNSSYPTHFFYYLLYFVKRWLKTINFWVFFFQTYQWVSR